MTASEISLKDILRSARYRVITESEEQSAHDAIDIIKRVAAGLPATTEQAQAKIEGMFKIGDNQVEEAWFGGKPKKR